MGKMLKQLPKGSKGLTLLEILLALLVAGIFLSLSLHLLIGYWRAAREVKDRLEIQYSLVTAGKTVSDAIRTAQSVQWVEQARVLKIRPGQTGTSTDLYYIDDKDYDGVKDLYWEHLNVPNPVASSISAWSCKEVEPGLWQVWLQATLGGQQAQWEELIRQRSGPVSSG